MLLWHMHQPYYKDLVDDRYTMPWVRLHALKDYYGMVAMLRDFPSVHVTFNLVPSLVSQLLDYASGAAHEDAFDLAFMPPAKMSPEEKQRFVRAAFQINHENLLSVYPRFWELFVKSKGTGEEPSADLISTEQEIRDLQVISQVAWFDEIYLARDPLIRELAQRERGFTEEDKQNLRLKEVEIVKGTLEEYHRAAVRGQVELSTSPFYHPILPLVCDTNAGAESTPGLPLPSQRFQYPEDARGQLRQAIDLHEKVFGGRPVGLWPSEGSVSAEALRLAVEEGFTWAATDEGVLGRSLETFFRRHPDGTVDDGRRLYTPYSFDAGDHPIALFFRDHPISDLIGFVYSRMDPADAAADLIARIRTAAANAGDRPAVVSVILDGENAWEYYPANGREFLKRFYGLVASQPDIQAMTPSEILAVTEPPALPHLTPGSWINANFNVWIGASEDNRAWDLLSDARRFFEEHKADAASDPASVALAQQEIYVSEGSDWCWWYGPEHSTANDEEFDHLYRKHLSNVYRLLGASAPDELATPIKRQRSAGYSVPPTGPISPVIDGRETTYFEWLGAGVYVPDQRSGSIHASSGYVKELFYGQDDQAISIRIDFKSELTRRHRSFQVRIILKGEHSARLSATMEGDALGAVELWLDDQQISVPEAAGDRVIVAYQTILECRLDRSLLGLGRSPSLQASVWLDQLPAQVLPREGRLDLQPHEGSAGW